MQIRPKLGKLVGAALLTASFQASAVLITTTPFDLNASLFPMTAQGTNGIFLQSRPGGVLVTGGSAVYTNLSFFDANTWGTPGAPWGIPIIESLPGGGIRAHPGAVTQVGADTDPVIRILIHGGSGLLNISGSTGSDNSAAYDYYIYLGATGFAAPLWTGGAGVSFNFDIPYDIAGDELFLATNAGPNDVGDWASWHGVNIVGIGNVGQVPEPGSLVLTLGALALLAGMRRKPAA